MPGVSVAELVMLRADAESEMLDTCKIGTKVAGGSAVEPSKGKYAYGDAISCGFDSSPSSEAQDGSQRTLTDGEIRLPIGTSVSSVNAIQVTHRQGAELGTAEVFEVVGEPRRGMTALVAQVKRL